MLYLQRRLDQLTSSIVDRNQLKLTVKMETENDQQSTKLIDPIISATEDIGYYDYLGTIHKV